MTDQSQEHSVRSPSSSHRWRRCAGAINAEKGRPDRVGREAAEGTMFHEHAELALRLGIEPEYFKTGLKQVISGHTVEYNDEMIEHMKGGLAYIEMRLQQYRDEFGEEPIVLVEQRVWIEPWTLEPGGFGTSDVCIIFLRWRKIIVFDWKYGKIAVSPMYLDEEDVERGNDQLTLYTLGCWQSLAAEYFDNDPTGVDVEMIIWQPRVPGAGGDWPTTMEAVLAEGERLREDARATYDPNAPRTPGPKQCQYCKANADCAELAQYNLERFGLRFDDIDDSLDFGIEPADPEISAWTPARKAFVLLHKKMFERWFKKLHEEAVLAAASGNAFPYTKLVMGREGDRMWRDKADDKASVKRLAEEILGEGKASEDRLLSPPALEEAVGKKGVKKAAFKKIFGDYIDRSPAKPILVPTTDSRIEIPSYGDKFNSLLEDDDEDGEG